MKKAKLSAGDVVLNLELCDTDLAEALYAEMPISGKADHWGEECHFAADANIDVQADTQEVLEKGAVAFISAGNIIAIGYGPTLWSEGEETRYEHPASVWATCSEDVSQLIFVPAEAPIKIEAA